MVSLDNVVVIISVRIPSRNSVVFYIHNFELVTNSKSNVFIPLFIFFIAMDKLTIRRQVCYIPTSSTIDDTCDIVAILKDDRSRFVSIWRPYTGRGRITPTRNRIEVIFSKRQISCLIPFSVPRRFSGSRIQTNEDNCTVAGRDSSGINIGSTLSQSHKVRPCIPFIIVCIDSIFCAISLPYTGLEIKRSISGKSNAWKSTFRKCTTI